MQRKILASRDRYETRVAVIEDGKLAEYYFERADQRRQAGNIYKGRVTAIVPGMEAAFIDIGQGRNAFLYAADVRQPNGEFSDIFRDDPPPDSADEAAGEVEEEEAANLPPPSIGDLLKEGQELLVQVDKEPIGAKGPRVTTNISLPGRCLVLLPVIDHIGVSLRIGDRAERERLREIAQRILPDGCGVIVRTAAEGRDEEDLRDDVDLLVRQWEAIQAHGERVHAPALVHRDLGLVGRILRDVFDEQSTEVVTDHPDLLEEVRMLAAERGDEVNGRLRLHDGNVSLMKETGVEAEVQGLLNRRIWLPSGGYIVIDEAEALTAIDVNTGRFVGKTNLEETVLATNLEAAAEIARQLRLRNIGGIIIIDFIDMREEISRNTVLESLAGHLHKDRARTQILQLTKLGLVEMTRKRVRKSLRSSLTQACPYCKREGTILSVDTMIVRVLRRVEDLCKSTYSDVALQVSERVAMTLNEEMADILDSLRSKYDREIIIQPVRNLHFEEIREGLLPEDEMGADWL